MSNINKILEFVSLTHRFQQVIRVLYVTNQDRDENDAEHSYQLAIMAWFIIESEGLDLDITKAIKYALVHDLVEVYAGDTNLYTKDQSLKDSKADREKTAAKRIKLEFPEVPEINSLIEMYETKEEPEAKFIYSLDKILPPMNIFLDKGRSWQREKVTYEMMISSKQGKVSVSPEIGKIWEEFLPILNQHRHYFPAE